MSRARNFADLINSPKGKPVTVASSGNVTLDLTGNNSFYDAGTTTGATAVTFGTPDTTTKRFTYSFIPGYDNSASSIDDMDTWVYDKSFQSPEGYDFSAIFNQDGTKYFGVSQTGDALYSCNVPVPYDVRSRTLYSKIHLASGTIAAAGPGNGTPIGPGNISVPNSIVWNNDGTRFYIVGNYSDAVNQFDVSTAYDINTSTVTHSATFSVSAQEGDPKAVRFKPDGTQMFVAGGSGRGFDVYNLSTAWDISTATFDAFYSVNSMTSAPTSTFIITEFFFNSDGTKVFLSQNSAYLKAYHSIDLSTAYDFSTATYDTTKFFSLNEFTFLNYLFGTSEIPLDRVVMPNARYVRIERGTSYHPTFATSFTGYPTFFSRGCRHNLEFQTTDGGSNYQLLNHNKVQV